MSSPADQIASIVPDTVIDGSTDWTTKVGKMPSEPDQVACYYDTGGAPPSPAYRLDYRTFMIHVRGKPNDYANAYQKAQDLKDVLLGIDPQDLPSGDHISGIVMSSDIAFLFYDDQQRPILSLNFRVFWEPAPNALNTARSSL